MQQSEIPNTFYRVSMKGLILDEANEKFAVLLGDNGWWDLPGGALDWGESPEECLRREVKEEMGLTITEIDSSPSYFLSNKTHKGTWIAIVIFKIKVENLGFTPSGECREIKFISPEEIDSINAFDIIKKFAKLLKNKN